MRNRKVVCVSLDPRTIKKLKIIKKKTDAPASRTVDRAVDLYHTKVMK